MTRRKKTWILDEVGRRGVRDRKFARGSSLKEKVKGTTRRDESEKRVGSVQTIFEGREQDLTRMGELTSSSRTSSRGRVRTTRSQRDETDPPAEVDPPSERPKEREVDFRPGWETRNPLKVGGERM